MKNCFRHLLNCTVLLVTTIAPAAGEVEIMLAGPLYGDNVRVESVPDWWGLFEREGGYVLEPAPLRVVVKRGAKPDDSGAVEEEYAVESEKLPIVLIRGMKEFKSGPVTTATLQPARWNSEQATPLRMNSFLYPGQSIWITLPAETIRITAFGVAEEDAEFHHANLMNYEIRIYRGEEEKAVSQTMITIPRMGDLGEPHLVWAGDLDQDGKMDFLFDFKTHYYVRHLALFLSTAAKDGEIVGKVAEWQHTGC